MCCFAEALGHDAEALGAVDAVLDGDAEIAQAAIVVLLLDAQLVALALPVWNLDRRVLTLVALIGVVGVESLRALQLGSFVADREVMAAASM